VVQHDARELLQQLDEPLDRTVLDQRMAAVRPAPDRTDGGHPSGPGTGITPDWAQVTVKEQQTHDGGLALDQDHPQDGEAPTVNGRQTVPPPRLRWRPGTAMLKATVMAQQQVRDVRIFAEPKQLVRFQADAADPVTVNGQQIKPAAPGHLSLPVGVETPLTVSPASPNWMGARWRSTWLVDRYPVPAIPYPPPTARRRR
jgi:hypothetical protein